jgi:hypothetical protein
MNNSMPLELEFMNLTNLYNLRSRNVLAVPGYCSLA